MSDTFCDATGEYVNENSGSSTAVVSSTGEVLENGAILTDLIKLNYDFPVEPNIPLPKSYNIYIWNNNDDGEIRFYTKDAKNNNDYNKNLFTGNYTNPRLNYNTKIGKDGKLYYYHNYTSYNPAKLSGWVDIDSNFNGVEGQLTIIDVFIGTLNVGQIALQSQLDSVITSIATKFAVIDSVLGEHEVRLNFIEFSPIENMNIFDWDSTVYNANTIYMTTKRALQENMKKGGAGFSRLRQRVIARNRTKLSSIITKIFNDALTTIAIIGFTAGLYGVMREILDRKKAENYSDELLGLSDNLSQLSISATADTINHTRITIVSGNTGFTSVNTTYIVSVQREAVIVIYINSSSIASVVNVEEYGSSDFSVSETISIPKASLGGGTGGDLVLSVASLGTEKEWTELRTTYLQNKITGIQVKNRRKQNVIGADDIDTGQFTTTNVSYTDTTDPVNETITYKQLKSRLSLLPTGTNDVNVYTMGNVGIGTTGSVSTNKLDILGSTKFMGMMGIGASPPLVGDAFVPLLKVYSDLETTLYIRGANTTGSASIEFSLGERLDPTADFRLANLGGGDGLYLQYQDETVAYNATGSDLICFKPLLTNFYKDVDINGKCGIGTTATTGVKLHAYDADDCLIRLSTGTGSTDKTQIQFIKGTTTDTNTDYRLISDLTIFKLQYATNTIAFGASANASDLMAWRSTSTTIYKNTVMSASCAIGGASIDANYKLNISGDVNISAGSVYRIDGTAIPSFQLTAGTGITINNGAINADTQLTAGSGITITSGSISANTQLTAGSGITITSGTISANTQLTAGSGITITSGSISANTQLTAGSRISIVNGVISAFTGGTRDAGTITGTLAIGNGGTGGNDIGVGAIPFGSTLEDKYSWTADLRYDATNKRLGLGILTPLYTLDCDGNINIPTGSTYKINGADLSYTNLTNQLTAGTNITITSGAINASVPAQLTAGTGITITSGAINADTQLTAGNNILIQNGVIDAVVPAQLTAGTGITITSGAINATQLTAGNNITITSGAINAIVPAQLTAGTGITITSGAINTNLSAGVGITIVGGTTINATQLTAGTNITITSGAINATVPTTFDATAITSGTLSLSRGGTGTTTIGNGTLVFGNTFQNGYTWNNLLKWDNTNSRLGVGITTPLYTLDVGGTSRFSSQITATNIIQHQTGLWNKSSDGGNRYYFETNGISFFSGGTSGSANARMHEWRRTYDGATLGYFENTGLFRSWGYSTLSDERIKKNIRDIDDNEALDKILLIQPKKYNYVEIEKSKDDIIGFIAQQIGEVIPEAITKTEGIPPNIYKYVSVKNKDEICYSLPSNVEIGTEVIITDTEEGTGDRYKIQEIYDDYFVIDKEIEGDVAFVKGYSIKDLHNLNKDYIFTLNVSATQELHRKIISQEERIRQLEEKVDRLLNYLA
jgi:hypothetical protein